MSSSDPFEQLQERLDNPADPWYWEADETAPENAIVAKSISGLVEHIEERTSDYGPYPFVVITTRDGKRVSVAGLGTVLTRALANLAPGDMVAIQYLGLEPSKKPGLNDYANFAVERIAAADLA